MRLSCTDETISLISLTSSEMELTGETSARMRQRLRRNVTKTVRYGDGKVMICREIKSKKFEY